MRASQAGRWALAALALAALATVYSNPYFPPWIHAGMPIVAAASVLSPEAALVAIAGVGPFANLLVDATGAPPLRALEALVLAFLAGWLLRGPGVRHGTAASRLLIPAGLLAALAVTSSASLALELYRASRPQFASTLDALWRWYLWTDDPTGIVAAVAIVEGLLLLMAVVQMTEKRPALALTLMNALAAGGAAAALLALLMALGLLPDALARHFRIPQRRYVVHIADVNAAASYFALLLGLACGRAASTMRRRRAIWSAVAAILTIGLVLTGSRSGLAAVAIVSVASLGYAMVRGRDMRPPRALLVALGLCLAAAVGIAFMRTFTFASEMRGEFLISSVRMLASRPILGVGIGRYYPLSELALTPRLGSLYAQENAHNYFLQITCELGIAGGIAFAAVLVAALLPAARSLGDRSRDFVSAGLFGGLAAFLITCLTGHPFLVREAAVPFWMALGLAIVAAGPLAAPARRPLAAPVALAAAALLVASVPFRPGVPRLKLRAGEDGFFNQRDTGDGRVHTMGAFASLYVGPEVTAIEIPMRLADRARPALLVLDQEPGWSQHWTHVGGDWVVVQATLPTAAPLMPFQRINLSVLNGDGTAPADPEGALIDVRDVVITGARDERRGGR